MVDAGCGCCSVLKHLASTGALPRRLPGTCDTGSVQHCVVGMLRHQHALRAACFHCSCLCANTLEAAHPQGHCKSRELERQLDIPGLIARLQQHERGLHDWAYLHRAHLVLLECRRVLANGYAFSYYMFNPADWRQVRVS